MGNQGSQPSVNLNQRESLVVNTTHSETKNLSLNIAILSVLAGAIVIAVLFFAYKQCKTHLIREL